VPGRLLSFLGTDSIQQKRMVDVILMAALADDALSQTTLDLIAKAIQKNQELAGISWEWIVARSRELALDAPLFSDTRQAVIAELEDRSLRRFAISLAAKIVGAGRQLSSGERAILSELDFELKIMGTDLDKLLIPSEGEDARGFLRSITNDPTDLEAPTLFDAIAKAQNDDELRLLTYKLYAIRRMIDLLPAGAELTSVAEGVRMGHHFARVDAVIDLPNSGRFIVRCLAEGETMHAAEHECLAGIAGELKELSFLTIVHQGSITPMDQEFLDGLDQTKLRVEKVDIYEAVT
jgi:hypothetical protein